MSYIKEDGQLDLLAINIALTQVDLAGARMCRDRIRFWEKRIGSIPEAHRRVETWKKLYEDEYGQDDQ